MHDFNQTGASCLDGSPAVIYYSKGYGSGANKSVIHFSGGGWCYGFTPDHVAKDCLTRSMTLLGSSKFTHETETYADDPFSGDVNNDMNYYNWNRYLIKYCDGTGH
jgi:O-palmitoleoyl-L-serine hydrolase